MKHGDLSLVGVQPIDEAVYRELLRRPGPRAEGLESAVGLSGEALRLSLKRLEQHGLVKVGVSGELTVTDPAVGVERLIERRLRELQDEQWQVLASRCLAASMLEEWREWPHSVPDAVERVEGLDQVRARIDELAFYVRSEMLALQPTGAFSAEAIAATRIPDLRCLRRGVTMRTIVRPAALTDPATAAYLRELLQNGAQIRVSDGPLERVLIFDRRTALVSSDAGTGSPGALLVGQDGLLSALLALFERAWSEAADATPALLPDTLDEDRPTEVLRRVLSVMAHVDKDEAGAREMGISVRTYRAHVAQLMHRLNASNRFQVALLARERGWI